MLTWQQIGDNLVLYFVNSRSFVAIMFLPLNFMFSSMLVLYYLNGQFSSMIVYGFVEVLLLITVG